MTAVIVSDLASEDLIEIWCYVAEDKVSAADALIDSFEATFATLADRPGIGKQRPELGKELQSFPVKSYVIFYRQTGDGIEVARVLSGYRDIESLF